MKGIAFPFALIFLLFSPLFASASNVVTVSISADKAEYIKGKDTQITLTVNVSNSGSAVTTRVVGGLAGGNQQSYGTSWTTNGEHTVPVSGADFTSMQQGTYTFTAVASKATGEDETSDNTASVSVLVKNPRNANIPEMPEAFAIIIAFGIIGVIAGKSRQWKN